MHFLYTDECAPARLNILLYETRHDDKNTLATMLDPTLVKILVASEPQVAREILLKRLRVAMAWMRLPVVIIIPGKDKRLAKILEEHGVADYLIKPFAAEALMERITSVMRR